MLCRAPAVRCAQCDKFDEAMAVLDPDKSCAIKFVELKIRGRWVLLNYGDRDIDGRERPIETVEQLLDAVFELAIVHEVLTARKNNRMAKLWRKLLMIMVNHGQAVVRLERRRSSHSMISNGSLAESEGAPTPGRGRPPVGTPARGSVKAQTPARARTRSAASTTSAASAPSAASSADDEAAVVLPGGLGI